MRKLLTILPLVAISLFALMPHSPTAVAQNAVSIEYWNINNQGFGGATVDLLIEQFEAANPGINVEARVQES